MKAFSRLLILIFLISFGFAQAQKGKIAGKVIDKNTGEEIIGATVAIEGQTIGSSTDIEGRFSISIEPGKYVVNVIYLSYKTLRFENIEVNANEIYNLNCALEEASKELDEVVVQAAFDKSSQANILIERKNAVQVSDGISAELIKKTPDRSSSDVLRRVTGASIQEGKFAIIRGLNDRYNMAMINGTPLPSSESDRKAFAFDIIPANLLDNMTIIKTATPDMPGDWAGGVINIKTKDIPEKRFFNIGVNGTFNTITTGRQFKGYTGGKTDFLGLDDGTRQLPASYPKTKDDYVGDDTKQIEAARLYSQKNPDWSIRDVGPALPSGSGQFSFGNTYKVSSTSKFGAIAALNYNNTPDYKQSERGKLFAIPQGNTPLEQDIKYTDNEYRRYILWGGLLNLSFILGENHKFSFKNIYNVNSNDFVLDRSGTTEYNSGPTALVSKINTKWWTQNQLLTSQLSGDHYFPAIKSKIKWIGGYGDIERQMPNVARSIYNKASGDTAYKAAVTFSNITPSNGGNLFYLTNRERIYSFNAEGTYSNKSIRTDIKIGGNIQRRERSFSSRSIGYNRFLNGGSYLDSLIRLQEKDVFSPANIGYNSDSTGIGFKMTESTKTSDAYTASSDLYAAFLMADTRITQQLRVIYGARIEVWNLKLNSFTNEGESVKVDTTNLDILPSVNAIYSLSEKTNLRLSYFRTLNRPEFREVAPFLFFDYQYYISYQGFPSIKRAVVDNFDARFEYYPGAGQVIAVSAFYKYLTNPIELYLQIGGSGPLSAIYKNASHAQIAGVEFEVRQNLGVLFGNPTGLLGDFTPFANLSLIYSNVRTDTTKIGGLESNDRVLQGQSPYIVNAGIQYQNEKSGWSSALSFNQVGPRVFLVGTRDQPSVWENPRALLDFQVNKSFKNGLEFKVTLGDLLAQNLVFYQDLDKNGIYNSDRDFAINRSTFGRNIRVGVQYTF